MGQVRILIADDHRIINRKLRALIERERDWTVCGEVRTFRDAIASAIDLKPDVVLLDVNMAGVNGHVAAHQVRRAAPGAAIVVMTKYDSMDFRRAAIDAGANGFLSKAIGEPRLIAALRAALSRKMLGTNHNRDARGHHDHGTPHARRLTPRETEVLHLLAQGHTNKQVAHQLGITPKTAETHRAHIIAKLDLHSISGLVRYAIRQHLIDP
jgi:DNA-binding NarL/FixJ family response regulator